MSATHATGSLFTVLRVPAALGHVIQEADERPGADKVVLLSHALWQRWFGGDPGVLGSSLRVDGEVRRVIGVMPEGFHFPDAETELWIPVTLDLAGLQMGNFNFGGLGRMRSGTTAGQADRELSALVQRIPEAGGEEQGITRGMLEQAKLSVVVEPLRDAVVGDLENILWTLLGGVGLVLLIACANVANLFLVRAESRQREMAVRSALGASRREIARLFLAESLALALAGGAVGILLAAAGVRLLVRLRPQGIPRLEEIGVDGSVLAFTVLLSLLAGVLVGVLAAFRFNAPDLMPSLKEGGRGGGMAGVGRARHLARHVLVAFQVAFALMLLVGAVLMVQSFWRLRDVDPGLRPEGVLTLRLDLPAAKYQDPPSAARFVTQLLEQVRALPGVASAGTVSELPLTGRLTGGGHVIEDHPLPPDTLPTLIGYRTVSPGYFETMGIPLIAGRTFDRLDPDRPADGVVVSEAVAKRFWPQGSALGKRLSPGDPEEPRWFTIAGVVGSVREQRLEEPPTEVVYYPVRARAAGAPADAEAVSRSFSLVVHSTSGRPESHVQPIQKVIRSLDPSLPLFEVRTMQEVVDRSMARTSFTMLLLVIAAAMALLLASVGLYGVISYVMSQRTQEIGVRMALGARRLDIVRMVLREGLVVTLAGIALGLAGALGVTRLMRGLLYGVEPADPVTFSLVPILLAAIALFASWLPAQRAAEVEPLEAIRYE